jgi:hypothetical protein
MKDEDEARHSKPMLIPHYSGGKLKPLSEEAFDQLAEEAGVAAQRLDAQIWKWGNDPAREEDDGFLVDDLLHAQLAWLIGQRGGFSSIGERHFLRQAFCEWNKETSARNVALALNWDCGNDLDFVNATRPWFLDRWFATNCPVVRIDERTAAGMALTSVPANIADEDIKLPWSAFKLTLPVNLIPSTVPGAFYTRIEVYREDTPVRRWFITAIDETGHIDQIVRGSFAELIRPQDWRLQTRQVVARAVQEMGEILAGGDEDLFLEKLKQLEDLKCPQACKHHRLIGLLIGRIVAGSIFFMTEGGGVLKKRVDRSKPKWRRAQRAKEPQTTEYILLPPSQIKFPNLATAVTAMLALAEGDRGPKNLQILQWVVRGHWRNQACGRALKDHKWLWITPYWKGPDDAKRAVRERDVTHRDE